jgi:glycosyltransferase involved in cell wall biosynthesis
MVSSTRVPLFSVVIPTYNREADLRSCLDCLAPGAQETAWPAVAGSAGGRPDRIECIEYEVIVSNDGEDLPAVRRDYPWIAFVQGPRRGPAANRNCGAAAARGRWLAFVDDDCLPDRRWLAEHAIGTRTGARVLEGATHPVGRRESVDTEAPINLQGGFLWSCNFAILRSEFERLGGFDEGFPHPAMEDVDLNHRVRLAGIPKAFRAAAIVRHPYRRMRGLAAARNHARSVAHFCGKYPAERDAYARSAGKRIYRLVRQRFEIALEARTLSGLARAIFLDVASVTLAYRRL